MDRDYPKYKYHPSQSAQVVYSKEDEKDLGDGWFNSPAEYGVETSPGIKPDSQIAKRKKLAGAK